MHDDHQAAGLPAARPAPLTPAPAIPCDRCGNFAELFVTWGRKLCEPCLDHRSAIESRPLTPGNLFVDTFALLWLVALPASVCMLAFAIPSALATQFSNPLGRIFDGFILVIATAAIQRLAFARVVIGPKAGIGDAFGLTLQRYWSIWGAGFLSNLISFLFMLLLIVPGVMRLLSYAMCVPIAINEGRAAGESLELSTTRMYGHRLPAFWGFCLLSLLVFTVLGVLAVALFAIGEGVLEADIDHPSFEVAVTVITLLSLIPLYLAAVVLQLKLTKPERVPVPGGAPKPAG